MQRKQDANSPPERLLALQRQFAGHLRDPESVRPPEGLEERRLAIYRRLFSGNLSNLFSKNFPILFRLLDQPHWQSLIRAFMREHRATTPMFTEIGREFVRFIDQQAPDGLPPFALELAHWEYLETTVRLAEADPNDLACDPEGDLLEQAPVLNPTLRLAQYQWPVHEIGPHFQPERPLDQAIVLAAWRKRDDRPGFMKLNAVTGRLLELIEQQPQWPGRSILATIASEMGAADTRTIVAAGGDMLKQLAGRDVVLGARPASAQ